MIGMFGDSHPLFSELFKTYHKTNVTKTHLQSPCTQEHIGIDGDSVCQDLRGLPWKLAQKLGRPRERAGLNEMVQDGERDGEGW
ncbi:hypothetical protein SRHO_G00238010 [Serrasalmus rhombeus]